MNSAMPNRPVGVVRFNGNSARKAKTLDAKQELECKQKVDTFQQGLTDLVAWDKQTHQNPVLLKVDTNSLTRHAQAFLRKQAMSPLWKANPYMIGIAGGSASGKSFATEIWQKIFKDEAANAEATSPESHGPVVDMLQFDYSYYRNFGEHRKALGDDQFFLKTNLDVPRSMTLDTAFQQLSQLKKGFALRVPHYSFADSARVEGYKIKAPTPFVMLEGLFALLPQNLRKLYDMKIFVDASEQVRSDRWWKRAASRDMKDNDAGRAMFNRAMTEHNNHIEPTKAYADIVLNGNSRQPELSETLTRLTQLMLKTFYPPAKTDANALPLDPLPTSQPTASPNNPGDATKISN